MKKILDRLMARQRRLVDSLNTPAPLHLATPKPSASELLAAATAEATAREAALRELKRGDLSAAMELLAPHAISATNVVTLMTLSQIHAAQGEFDTALSTLGRAEAIDPTDRRVWRLLAELYSVRGLHTDEVRYRRKLAFADPNAPATALVELVRAVFRATPPGVKPAVNEVKLASKKLAAAPDFTASVQVQFAEAVFSFGSMGKVARTHYVAASPCSPHERDQPAQWVRMIEWCDHVGAKHSRLAEGGVRAHRPAVAELRDVDVFPRFQWVPVVDGGRVALSGFLVNRVRLRSEDPFTPLLMHNGTHVELRLPGSMPVIDQPALLLGGLPNYYHNTVEFLSSLAVAETLGVNRNLPLVVNDDLAPFQIEQLGLLGYSKDQLIRVKDDQPVRFSQLTVPSRLVRGGRWMDPMMPRWFRQRLATTSSPSLHARKLYLSRAGSMHRRVDNEEELAAMLRQHGYEIVHPEQLSVREQVDLFAGASHLVAAAGEGLTNMLFAPPGASIVALYNRHLVQGGGDLYFDALAEACEHRFVAIHCHPAQVVAGQRVIDADLAVDIDAVRAALD